MSGIIFDSIAIPDFIEHFQVIPGSLFKTLGFNKFIITSKFFKMYFLKQGFREGIPGLIIAILGMFYVFLKYAKLWELKLQNRKEVAEEDIQTSGFFKDSADDF